MNNSNVCLTQYGCNLVQSDFQKRNNQVFEPDLNFPVRSITLIFAKN